MINILMVEKGRKESSQGSIKTTSMEVTAMTKKRLILVLTLVLFLSIAPSQIQALQSYSDTSIEIIQTVSFREAPSTSGTFIRYLRSGEKLEIISAPNSYWYEVRDSSGKLGFVSSSSKYIALTVIPIYSEANGEIVSSVSFRTGPSTSNQRIRYLSTGEQIWVLEKVNEYWYKAEDKNHIIGYLSTNPKYIKTTFNSLIDDEEADDAGQTNAQVVKSVSFRKGPSTSYERIRYLQAGEQLQIIAKHNSYWYEAKDTNGTIGYVSTSTSYIVSTFTEEAKVLPENAVELIIQAGMSYLGTPYEYGSSRFDTNTFDCSDFIRQSFLDGIGLKLPSDSRQQGDWVKEIYGGQAITDWQQLNRGDLMFFMSYKGSDAADYSNVNKSTEEITHVAIYLGNDQVLHTYSVESGGVVVSNIQGTNWEYRFLFGGQALPK